MFFLQNLLYHQCHVQNKREKKQSTEQIWWVVQRPPLSPLESYRSSTGDRANIPCCWFCSFFLGLFCTALSALPSGFPLKGGCWHVTNWEICCFAQLQKTVTAYPFFLEGLCKMCDAPSEPCCDSGFQQKAGPHQKKNTNLLVLRLQP